MPGGKERLAGALGALLGVVARLWLWSLRLGVAEDPRLVAVRDRPWILCFFHGRQFPLLAWKRRRPTVVLVSHSRDGAIQARALRSLGFRVVRGSSSRGGARGLAALVRSMRSAHDAAFAVDGPRGPIGVAKEGAIVAARSTGAVLVPMGSASARRKVLERAWDRFLLPWPFARVEVVLGAPIEPGAPDARTLLERAIAAANREAEQCALSS
jgi:lysophospholipid acyltransferase (LPLAT)-like uncharacterized protein